MLRMDFFPLEFFQDLLISTVADVMTIKTFNTMRLRRVS